MKDFESVAGYEKEKEELLQLRDFLHKMDDYSQMGVRIPKGVILYGKPGVGKTVMARAIADDGISLVEVRAADCCAENTDVKIQAAFRRAKESAPAVLLLDELDKIAGTSHVFFMPENDAVKKMLLQELDGLGENSGVLVVATCNSVESLGSALTRSGRFDRMLEMPLPDCDDRKKILAKYFGKLKISRLPDCGYLARITPGYTGAELECIVNESGICAVQSGRNSIKLDDVRNVINRLAFHGRTGANSRGIGRIAAVHEAGHAVVALKLMPDCVFGASIMSQGSSCGHVNIIGDENELASVTDRENQVCILLAGRAAERLCLNETYLGSESDLKGAYMGVYDLLARHGAYGYEYLDYGRCDSESCMDEPCGVEPNAKIAEILTRLESEAERIITAERAVFEKIVQALNSNYVLSRGELLALAGNKQKLKTKKERAA